MEIGQDDAADGGLGLGHVAVERGGQDHSGIQMHRADDAAQFGHQGGEGRVGRQIRHL